MSSLEENSQNISKLELHNEDLEQDLVDFKQELLTFFGGGALSIIQVL